MLDRAPALDVLESSLADGAGPRLRLLVDHAGKPYGAACAMRLAAPPDRVWAIIRDVALWADRVPMIHRARRAGDRVTIQLKFRIALYSTKFSVDMAVIDDGDSFELRYVRGEPAKLSLRFAVDDSGDGHSTIRASVSYDIYSLGWLVKIFLRHHPEIQFGVFTGTVLTVVDSMRRALEGS